MVATTACRRTTRSVARTDCGQRSFTDITGQTTDRFPNDPAIDESNPIDDPSILEEDAVVGIRRTTLSARLKAIYGDADKLDGFVGMVSERHVDGTEFGELQLAMWRKQFEALRDGDRLFYLNDPVLRAMERSYGISYRNTLADRIRLNTGTTVQPNVFKKTD